jgi:hypothetical protein
VSERIGFTGTREGLTDTQHLKLWEAIKRSGAKKAHHGCAIGADEEFALLAGSGLDPGRVIVGHPSNIPSQTSARALSVCDEVKPARPPLDRNEDIVDACDVLFACPAGPLEIMRSGTWATVRHARKRGKPIVLFYPDGSVKEEGAAP